MSKIFALLFTLPLIMTLTSCNGSNAQEDERIVNEVAECAAIAQIAKGKSTTVMFTEQYSVNDIYKPKTPAPGSHEPQVFKSTLILSTWFQFDENDLSKKATLTWEFDKTEYINYIPPSSDLLPHASVMFTKYPEYGEEVLIKMVGTVKYNSALAYAKYTIRLLNTVDA